MKSLWGTALLTTVSFAAAWFLVWRPIQSRFERAAKAREDIPGLRAAIAQARATIARRDAVQNELKPTTAAIRKLDLDVIAPPSNPFTWACARIAPLAAVRGVEVTRYSESSDRASTPLGTNGPWFGAYRISIELRGDVAKVLHFAELLETDYPCLQIHHLSVLHPLPQNPPTIMMTIEWPVWASAGKEENGPQLAKIKRNPNTPGRRLPIIGQNATATFQ